MRPMQFCSDKLNPGIDTSQPPSMLLSHTFQHPLTAIASGLVLKHIWEPSSHLTSFSHVEQLDDDRILMYRRKEHAQTWGQAWEQIVINRADQSVEVSAVGPNPDGSMVSVEVAQYTSAGEETKSALSIYDNQGKGLSRIEQYKMQLKNITDAIQFAAWNREKAEE
mgnify:CR=1 FL=1